MQYRIASSLFVTGALLWSLDASAAGSDAAVLASQCFGCHGENGVSLGPATPSIAGISRNYLIAAMLAFKFSSDVSRADDVVSKDRSLKDVVVLGRPSTMMARIAQGYSVEDIKAIAQYFSTRPFLRQPQQFDPAKAHEGEKLHKHYCEKCHEKGGRESEEDAGMMAGQWVPYLSYTLQDFASGEREMPKKMKERVKLMREERGAGTLDPLLNYWASEH
jgi:cytochrome subunit of sulfide dehydrogenase